MIASLMMYARPELDAAHGRFWALIRAHLREAGIDSPAQLSQQAAEFDVWQDPQLVLSQTCGMPYRLWLHDQVTLVGTPDYGLDGCPPGYYRSPLVVRGDDHRKDLDDFRDGVFAYNQTFSQSGYGAPYWEAAKSGFWFARRLHTGAHLASAQAVAEGAADIAALDAISWRLMTAFEPFAAKLRVLCWTDPTPGLPLITAQGADAEATFHAVSRAIADLDAQDAAALGIRGLVKIPKADYLAVPNPPEAAGARIKAA